MITSYIKYKLFHYYFPKLCPPALLGVDIAACGQELSTSTASYTPQCLQHLRKPPSGHEQQVT